MLQQLSDTQPQVTAAQRLLSRQLVCREVCTQLMLTQQAPQSTQGE